MANSKLQIGNRQLAIGNARDRTILVSHYAVLFLLLICFSGCDGGNRRAQQPTPTRTQENPIASTPNKQKETTFEEGLNYVKLGQFRYVMVFSLLNGGVMSQDDFDYLKTNAPQEVNQWVKTEGGRRVVSGSNFAFKQEQLSALQKRFKIEDYSDKK